MIWSKPQTRRPNADGAYSQDEATEPPSAAAAQPYAFDGVRDEQGRRQGFGTWSHPDGRSYVGQWRDDRRHGRGKFTYSDGSWYDGSYHEGYREGAGTFKSELIQYEGGWKHGFMHGHGTWTSQRLPGQEHGGCTYEGEFKNGARDGHGTARYGSGMTYVGQWRANSYDGRGVLSYRTKVVFQGEWRRGKKVKTFYHRLRGAADTLVRLLLYLADKVVFVGLALLLLLVAAAIPLIVFAPVTQT